MLQETNPENTSPSMGMGHAFCCMRYLRSLAGGNYDLATQPRQDLLGLGHVPGRVTYKIHKDQVAYAGVVRLDISAPLRAPFLPRATRHSSHRIKNGSAINSVSSKCVAQSSHRP